MGSAPPGWRCTCSWSPSRLSVPNGMRKSGLSCVVQLRAQMCCSRCLETVSDRGGFCTHQHSLQVSKTVNLDACGASFAFGEHQTGVQSARNDWCFAIVSSRDSRLEAELPPCRAVGSSWLHDGRVRRGVRGRSSRRARTMSWPTASHAAPNAFGTIFCPCQVHRSLAVS